ncbi:MAG: hypothetical protein H5U40_16980 [Polyangiaceae bacterium]|nr:hypothetical protein [Polyangiaceae bacterium]
MTEEQARRVAETDANWTGPKLIVLCAVTLGVAFVVLFSAAWGIIGPKTDQARPMIEYFTTD